MYLYMGKRSIIRLGFTFLFVLSLSVHSESQHNLESVVKDLEQMLSAPDCPPGLAETIEGYLRNLKKLDEQNQQGRKKDIAS